ncbi:MAG: hypothetical protein CVV49_13505 [Spirochaetae bacterium HGW-Spirochaetae-5]|nr:MAG: hypothetical protein CVV49_13505 [Spirochaetae bacterium HGW-Spirochaetae-5]
MKFLKISTMVLFSLLLVVSVSFTQENNALESANEKVDSGSEVVTETEKTAAAGTVTEPDSSASRTPVKIKTAVPVKKSETLKTADKKSPEKIAVAIPPDVEPEKGNNAKFDGDLLPVNEGNFKYKRIPDIKLVEITPETAVINTSTEMAASQVENTETGFLGLSETASDVIVKGGFLLLILVIFVIYKSRMSGPGNKSTKRRNVLNSYRK